MSANKAVVEIVLAVGSTIKELGSVPSGHLYAHLMGRMTIEQYNIIIGVLKSAGAVEEDNHILTWVGK